MDLAVFISKKIFGSMNNNHL